MTRTTAALLALLAAITLALLPWSTAPVVAAGVVAAVAWTGAAAWVDGVRDRDRDRAIHMYRAARLAAEAA